MEIKGEYRIAASREKVFAALNDTAVLKACIPGCESLEKTSDTEMKAKVRLRIGPVSASFTGKVTLSDIDPPNGYKISGEGQGGAAGFAKVAQVGARLIDGTAKKLADEFFGKFAAMVGGPPPAAAVAGAPSAGVVSPPSPPPAAAQRGYRHWLVIGVGAAVLIVIFLASR
jgi:carbon monoxide dehydrogenase subunit G